MTKCKNCGHEHLHGQLCYVWYEDEKAMRNAKTYCGCTNPEPEAILCQQ